MLDDILNPNGTPVEDREPISLVDVFQRLGWEEPLTSPIQGLEGAVMIVGTSMGHGVIGSVDEYPEEINDVYMQYPLSFQEMGQRDPVTGQVTGVSVGLARILNTIGFSKMARFRLDYFTILRRGSDKDSQMLKGYRETVSACMASDAGISVIPASEFSGLKKGPRRS